MGSHQASIAPHLVRVSGEPSQGGGPGLNKSFTCMLVDMSGKSETSTVRGSSSGWIPSAHPG